MIHYDCVNPKCRKHARSKLLKVMKITTNEEEVLCSCPHCRERAIVTIDRRR